MRSSRLAALLIVAALAIPSASAVAGPSRPERAVLRLANDARGPDLEWAPRIARFAERHARKMRAAGYLFHSDLSFPWRHCAGENVGVGSSVRSVFEAFMRSPDHRANILSPCFDRAGIGVVRGDGMVWIVMDFAG